MFAGNVVAFGFSYPAKLETKGNIIDNVEPRQQGVLLKKPIRVYRHPVAVRRAKFSADGDFIITLDDAGVLRVFPCNAGEPVFVRDIASLKPLDLWPATKSGVVYIRSSSGALAALETNLSVDAMWRLGLAMLPSGIATEERVRLGLNAEIPDWCVRHRKWPFLAGEYAPEVRDIGHAANIVREVSVKPASAQFRTLAAQYASEEADCIARLGLAIWEHYAGVVAHLTPTYHLREQKFDYRLVAEIFESLLEVADELRCPNVEAAMVALYHGPVTESIERRSAALPGR